MATPMKGNYIALILVPDEVCRQVVVRDHSGHLSFSFCVCFGSDADVSPVIGIQAPCLPVCLFVCLACVSRTTVALILVPDEICRHRTRCPIELPSLYPTCVPRVCDVLATYSLF